MKRYFSILLLLILIKPLLGQGSGALLYMTFPQSPVSAGAGWIGAAVPIKDASGFYYNPANLGFFSKENDLSLFIMPQKTDWLPKITSNITLESFSAAAGYNFQKENEDLPLSIGIGYLHNKLDYGSQFGKDSYDCFSIGAGYDYFLQFNLGFSVKSYSSIYSGINENYETKKVEANGTAFDLGAMINVPVIKLFDDEFFYDLDESTYLEPDINFTLGYSLSNLGDKVSYTDPAQSDPLSRTARLGYSFNYVFKLSNNWLDKLKLIDYSFTAEAQDILISRDDEGNSGYQNIFGGIKVYDNLIDLKGNNDIVVHKGHILRLFETVILLSGRMNGRGYDNRKTDGLGFSSEGLFKILSGVIDNRAVNYLMDHFVIEYYDTNFFVDSGLDTKYKGLIINYRGLEL
jgi:hypothetical protein